MSYCIRLQNASFRIKQKDKAAALEAVLAINARGVQEEIADQVRDNDNLITLAIVISAFGWKLIEDSYDNVASIRYDGDKAWREGDLFKALAPFVVDGSYIEVTGEDGDHFRWFFTRGGVLQQQAIISWEELP